MQTSDLIPNDVILGPPPEDAPQDDQATTLRTLVSALRTRADAITWGRRQVTNPSQTWLALCLSFVRQAFGLPALYPSATAAWEGAALKHRTTSPGSIPAGVPVFFKGGRFGHVVLSLGGGLCLSNDVVRRGRIDVVRIADITKAWGYPVLGWTGDLNGRSLPEPPPPAPTRVSNAHDIGKHLLDVLDAAVANGRKGTVRTERDVIRRALERMPKR